MKTVRQLDFNLRRYSSQTQCAPFVAVFGHDRPDKDVHHRRQDLCLDRLIVACLFLVKVVSNEYEYTQIAGKRVAVNVKHRDVSEKVLFLLLRKSSVRARQANDSTEDVAS